MAEPVDDDDHDHDGHDHHPVLASNQPDHSKKKKKKKKKRKKSKSNAPPYKTFQIVETVDDGITWENKRPVGQFDVLIVDSQDFVMDTFDYHKQPGNAKLRMLVQLSLDNYEKMLASSTNNTTTTNTTNTQTKAHDDDKDENVSPSSDQEEQDEESMMALSQSISSTIQDEWGGLFLVKVNKDDPHKWRPVDTLEAEEEIMRVFEANIQKKREEKKNAHDVKKETGEAEAVDGAGEQEQEQIQKRKEPHQEQAEGNADAYVTTAQEHDGPEHDNEQQHQEQELHSQTPSFKKQKTEAEAPVPALPTATPYENANGESYSANHTTTPMTSLKFSENGTPQFPPLPAGLMSPWMQNNASPSGMNFPSLPPLGEESQNNGPVEPQASSEAQSQGQAKPPPPGKRKRGRPRKGEVRNQPAPGRKKKKGRPPKTATTQQQQQQQQQQPLATRAPLEDRVPFVGRRRRNNLPYPREAHTIAPLSSSSPGLLHGDRLLLSSSGGHGEQFQFLYDESEAQQEYEQEQEEGQQERSSKEWLIQPPSAGPPFPLPPSEYEEGTKNNTLKRAKAFLKAKDPEWVEYFDKLCHTRVALYCNGNMKKWPTRVLRHTVKKSNKNMDTTLSPWIGEQQKMYRDYCAWEDAELEKRWPKAKPPAVPTLDQLDAMYNMQPCLQRPQEYYEGAYAMQHHGRLLRTQMNYQQTGPSQSQYQLSVGNPHHTGRRVTYDLNDFAIQAAAIVEATRMSQARELAAAHAKDVAHIIDPNKTSAQGPADSTGTDATASKLPDAANAKASGDNSTADPPTDTTTKKSCDSEDTKATETADTEKTAEQDEKKSQAVMEKAEHDKNTDSNTFRDTTKNAAASPAATTSKEPGDSEDMKAVEAAGTEKTADQDEKKSQTAMEKAEHDKNKDSDTVRVTRSAKQAAASPTATTTKSHGDSEAMEVADTEKSADQDEKNSQTAKDKAEHDKNKDSDTVRVTRSAKKAAASPAAATTKSHGDSEAMEVADTEKSAEQYEKKSQAAIEKAEHDKNKDSDTVRVTRSAKKAAASPAAATTKSHGDSEAMEVADTEKSAGQYEKKSQTAIEKAEHDKNKDSDTVRVTRSAKKAAADTKESSVENSANSDKQRDVVSGRKSTSTTGEEGQAVSSEKRRTRSSGGGKDKSSELGRTKKAEGVPAVAKKGGDAEASAEEKRESETKEAEEAAKEKEEAAEAEATEEAAREKREAEAKAAEVAATEKREAEEAAKKKREAEAKAAEEAAKERKEAEAKAAAEAAEAAAKERKGAEAKAAAEAAEEAAKERKEAEAKAAEVAAKERKEAEAKAAEVAAKERKEAEAKAAAEAAEEAARERREAEARQKNEELRELQRAKILLLDAIHFVWEPHQEPPRDAPEEWKESFLDLREYLRTRGDTAVPDTTELGTWCQLQRMRYQRSLAIMSEKSRSDSSVADGSAQSKSKTTPPLSRDQMDALRGLGFDYEDIDSSRFHVMYMKLLEFKNRVGDCLVPPPQNDNVCYPNEDEVDGGDGNNEESDYMVDDHADPRLFFWVQRVRFEYMKFQEAKEAAEERAAAAAAAEAAGVDEDGHAVVEQLLAEEKTAERAARNRKNTKCEEDNDDGTVVGHLLQSPAARNRKNSNCEEDNDDGTVVGHLLQSPSTKKPIKSMDDTYAGNGAGEKENDGENGGDGGRRTATSKTVKGKSKKKEEPPSSETVSTLTQEQIDLLNSVGFIWSMDITDKWCRQYRRLQAFYIKNGHCKVTKTTNEAKTKLNRWCSQMRTLHQRNANGGNCGLSQEKLALLKRLDFIFEFDDLPERLSFKERFESLKRYKEENGHCNVPQKHTELGHFVKRLRKEYEAHKKGTKVMNPEKLRMCNDIGFVWRVRVVRGTRRRTKSLPPEDEEEEDEDEDENEEENDDGDDEDDEGEDDDDEEDGQEEEEAADPVATESSGRRRHRNRLPTHNRPSHQTSKSPRNRSSSESSFQCGLCMRSIIFASAQCGRCQRSYCQECFDDTIRHRNGNNAQSCPSCAGHVSLYGGTNWAGV